MSGADSIVAGVAERYATALFELAEASQASPAAGLDQVAGDLAALKRLIQESADLQRVVRSPVFGRDETRAAVLAVMEKAGIGELVRRFVGVVAENRRLFALLDMIDAYQALLAKHRGEVTAKVTSAHALSDSQVAALKDTLKASMGKDVQVDTNVDASLLGGLVVKVGSRMIDSSLRTKLNNLKIAMKEAG